MIKPFIYGFIVALIISLYMMSLYGEYREKIGFFEGRKKGTITVIDFLADHFPEPNNEPIEAGHFLGVGWYEIDVVETNGINSLRVKNKMSNSN